MLHILVWISVAAIGFVITKGVAYVGDLIEEVMGF